MAIGGSSCYCLADLVARIIDVGCICLGSFFRLKKPLKIDLCVSGFGVLSTWKTRFMHFEAIKLRKRGQKPLDGLRNKRDPEHTLLPFGIYLSHSMPKC